MESVRRVFVEKRPGFDIEAQHLLAGIREDLGIKSVKTLRIFKRYDFSGVTDSEATIAKDSILSEPNCDFVYDETLPAMDGLQLFAVESLPGQYDQRTPPRNASSSSRRRNALSLEPQRFTLLTRPFPPSISTKSKSILSIPSKPARPLWTSPNRLK